MQIPVQVTFRDMDSSDAMREACLKESEKLERVHDRLTRCRVVIAVPHKHQNKGLLYNVAVDVTFPGGEVVVNREHHERHSHEDPYVAIRDAFKIVRRQLEDFLRKRRGDVKSHEEPPHGRVRNLVPAENFGFIETADGRELYFHRNAVLNDGYDKLTVGTQVRFVEEQGNDGPQATSVRPSGRAANPASA